MLRAQTRPLHERLDTKLAPLAEGGRADYAAFLSISYAARRAIEAALTQIPSYGLVPPPASQLIERDLRELGHPLPTPLSMPVPHRDQALGMAWALGGSSLGNRVLLARRKERGRGGPTHFLADRTGAVFFKTLLPLLARPARADTAREAIAGAEAVFSLFLRAASCEPKVQAA